ncbi:alpha/beta fold hydrolase [Pseudophaeobacter sp.]|uniref:alpha/beta hydrolase family esterase n=1 Tax=Pseudophaeobacter sp. TaxID=1971739 RepID=UPI0032983D2B
MRRAARTLGALVGATLGGTALGWVGPAAAGCGDATEAACETAMGSYHIEMPERVAGEDPAPAVLFLHGYGGSGAGSLKNRTMVEGLRTRGYAVIAPDALPRRNGTRSWTFFPGWEGRDEAAFLQEVAADAAAQFDLDRDTMVLAGFSAGAFMVSYLACAAPESFAAYAPVAGGFWRPQPEACAAPVRLFHTHGWSDAVVPLEGRFLGGGRFQQGDIYAGLELWRDTNQCAEQAPDRRWNMGGTLRRSWHCGSGADIEFLLFPGGHQVPKGWSSWMLDWFETVEPGAG